MTSRPSAAVVSVIIRAASLFECLTSPPLMNSEQRLKNGDRVSKQ